MAVPETSRVARAVELLRPVVGERALPLAYRLLYVELARQRGVDVPLDQAVSGVCASVPVPTWQVLEGLRTESGGVVADDARALGELHQALLPPLERKAAGAYFTPQWLIEHLLDQALEPALDLTPPHEVLLCDPSCGSGLFLVAAARRFARRGVPVEHVLRHCLYGVDLDPGAVELARVSLWLEALAAGVTARPDVHLHVGDALGETAWVRPFDVVVGNPPFLNRLERRSGIDAVTRRRLAETSGGVVGPYTDLSAVFLHRAVSWVRPGGWIGLVQPQSLLATRDTGRLRADLATTCSLESLWASDRPVFDAGVLTCAPVLRRGGVQGRVIRHQGAACEPRPSVSLDESGTWSHLVAEALGVPEVDLVRRAGPVTRIADLAACTADFRDQYYGLAPHVREAVDCPEGTPLVTTGMVDPASNGWGVEPARFLKQRWSAPVIDMASLSEDPLLHRWAQARLVPKVLVGTQGKVIEAVVDDEGAWLPSVPLITVAAAPDSLWHLLAVLLAPPVAAYAATTYAGSGLTMRAIKLSARQVGALPLPADTSAWGEGASLARLAQDEPHERAEHLRALGRVMCAAYGVAPGDVLTWWLERVPRTHPQSRRTTTDPPGFLSR